MFRITNHGLCTGSCSLSRLQYYLIHRQCSLPVAVFQTTRKYHRSTTASCNSCSSKRSSRSGYRYSRSIPCGASTGYCSINRLRGWLWTLEDERVKWRGLIPFRSHSTSTYHQKSSSGRSSSWQKAANKNTVMYAVAIAIAVTGLSYAAVPLYRIFCQALGYGGTVVKREASEKVEAMEPIRERELTIRFNADTSSALLWKFRPHQLEIKVVPGETALAFYSARNPTDKPVVGIATYNVIPFEAGVYFNKIQCFCFEEQRLNPNEEVDMPVFFYIDPEFDDDPAMAKVNTITLSYTFFESKEGVDLPQPLTQS